jgi:uncharacterized protein
METALPSNPPAASSPAIPPIERFDSVDLIRGTAVCGILVMNIVSFAMPAAAYLNPEAYLGDRLSSHLVYALTHIFADQKFMGLFSLLFGSSVMLFLHKLEASSLTPLRFYYSRTLWLLVFGLLHGLLLWEGDILLYYALGGLFLYPFRYLPPALNFTLGLLVFLSALVIDRYGQVLIESLPPAALESLAPTWSPNESDVAFETLVRLSSYSEQLAHRNLIPQGYSDHALDVVASTYVTQGLARAFGLMLVGMAFYSWGIVTAQRSREFYRWLVRVGLTLGVPLATYGLWQNYLHDWQITYGLFAGLAYNHLATLLLVAAYTGILMSLQLRQLFTPLRRGLCAIGRMAFTNYIGQSLMATLIFYGYGLGLFGQLNRLELFIPVIGIWIFQFYFSLWWLKYFRYGPLEWLWRTLTYMKIPQLRNPKNSAQ